MDEPPASALRRKKDSSMRVAINLVKNGAAQACVSAGNTGALMAISRFVLKTLPGIDRPAIASQLPTRNRRHDRARSRRQRQLHAGAAAAVRASWAARWSRRSTASSGRPSACSISATRTSRATKSSSGPRELLKASGLNFYGNVEGNDIYKGTTDVVVCDGFVGNVALKTSEGLARMLGDFLREEFTRNLLRKAAGAVRAAGAERVQAAHRSAPLQRRDADRLEGHRGQEPRLGRRARVRLRAAQGLRRGRARRPRPHRAAHRVDADPVDRIGCRDGCAGPDAMYSRIAGTGGYLPAAGR